MTPEAILNRIKPTGTVDVAGGVVQTAAVEVELGPDAGEERYKSTCKVCHESGMAGAPKFRNEAEWKPRMSVGIDEMLKIAIAGKGAMPPRGNCPQCSDKELKMAIEYMIPQKK
jgi:cytochrome c5